MDNTALNGIKERLLKDNDTRRWREIGNANAFANGYAYGVEDTLVAVAAAAEAAEQQAQLKPRTNLDRIRAMSVENIADWVAQNLECDSCPISVSGGRGCETNCAAAFVKWLNSPVKEDGNEH